MAHATAMLANETALLVVDVQEKLMAKIPAANALVQDIGFLIDVARLIGVEVLATEQYPRGLGPTVAALAARLPTRPDKVAFSCCAVSGLIEGLRHNRRTRVLLAGIEAHVCVLHTALDLLAAGFAVYLAADACASRYAIDRKFGACGAWSRPARSSRRPRPRRSSGSAARRIRSSKRSVPWCRNA